MSFYSGENQLNPFEILAKTLNGAILPLPPVQLGLMTFVNRTFHFDFTNNDVNKLMTAWRHAFNKVKIKIGLAWPGNQSDD